MLRLLAAGVVALLANALAIVVTAWALEDVRLDAVGFVLEVAIFTGVMLLLEPFLKKLALTHARALIGSTALMATLVALVVTVALTDGLRISGTGTWILATVLVWAIALVARLLLPLLIFKQTLARRDLRR
jgi:putative membrane protein